MKPIIVATVALLVSITSFSQKKSKDTRIGFLVEPNISWFHPNENGVKNDGSKMGINYGLMLDYEFSDSYIFSTGLQISHTGGKLSYTGNAWTDKHVGYVVADNSSVNNTANYNVGLQYLQIPFAIKLLSDNKSKTNFWGSFGGFIAIPLKARADVETNFTVGGNSVNYSKNNDNIIGNVQPINLGMQIGAGVELPISDKNILVAGLIFNNGFIDVTKNSSWGGDGRINLNSIALKIGVFF
ncbi:MAG: porin family protein [Bacteroidetes bacterium]|nr:porin family protein [Bacteroidota bacterium]